MHACMHTYVDEYPNADDLLPDVVNVCMHAYIHSYPCAGDVRLGAAKSMEKWRQERGVEVQCGQKTPRRPGMYLCIHVYTIITTYIGRHDVIHVCTCV
jgi:hypothetical protein